MNIFREFFGKPLKAAQEAKEQKTASDYVSCEQWLAGKRFSDLAPDEREEVSQAFGPLRNQQYLSNHVDNILGASAAATLCKLATGTVKEVAELESDSELASELRTAGGVEARQYLGEITARKERAVWLAQKAIEVYPHPEMFARLANLLEALGSHQEATRMRGLFKQQKANWTVKYTDQFLMMNLNH